MSSTATSTHLLDIEQDYASVLNGVQCLSANWRKIGLSLGVPYNTVDAIEGERKKASDMLMDLLAVWLRRESEGQPKPTWKKLCEAVSTIDRTRAEVLAQEHQCDCPVCLAGTRNTHVANEIQNYNVVEAARALKEEFNELMAFTAKEIRLADAEELRFRINAFVKDERGKPCEVVETHLSRIEDYVAPSAILNYLYRYEFIGYINYALIKVVQKQIQSKLLDKHIKEYENDYQLFLQCALKDIHAAFKSCPDLQPNYPVGLPSFIIHLESEWDGQSMYKWKELFERRFSWPETLNVVKISENCITITYTVWPKFAEEVAKDLTDPEIISDLKKEGVTIKISPQLQAYLHHDSDLLSTSKKEVFVTVEDQLIIEHQSKADVLTGPVGDTDDDTSDVSIDTIPEVQTLKGGQPAGGMLSIKPDWDERVADDDTSGYVSMKPNSDGQTVASGDTEGHQLVELQDDVTLKEAIDTYERIVKKILQQKKSFEKQLVIEREMRMKAIMELDQTKAQYLKSKHSSVDHHSRVDDTRLLHIEKILTYREKVLETMRRDIGRLQERVAGLKGETKLSDQELSDLNKKLLEAAERDSTEDVQLFLSSGAEANTRERGYLSYQRAPLHLASEHGHQSVVETLLNHGAMIEASNKIQRTPLHLASGSGHQSVVETLLNHGAMIEASDVDQRTPLHLASGSGHQSVVETLINYGAKIEASDVYQCTPLHLASESGHQSVIVTLLNNGAMIEASNKYQRTPLHLASGSGHQSVVETLLNHGAMIEASNEGQYTPLHFASERGHQSVVETLLNHGAMTKASNKMQYTPLHLASENGHQSVVETLLNHGAMIEASDRFPGLAQQCNIQSIQYKEYQRTPLHFASERGHQSVVETLLNHGAMIEASDENDQSPLHRSLLWDHPDVAILLINSGANIHKKDKYGQSAVLIAAVLNRSRVIEQCLSKRVSTDTLMKYYLPTGWKTHNFFKDDLVKIWYTNTATGLTQDVHPNISDLQLLLNI